MRRRWSRVTRSKDGKISRGYKEIAAHDVELSRRRSEDVRERRFVTLLTYNRFFTGSRYSLTVRFL